VCVCVCVCVCLEFGGGGACAFVYVCMYVCMYVCVTGHSWFWAQQIIVCPAFACLTIIKISSYKNKQTNKIMLVRAPGLQLLITICLEFVLTTKLGWSILIWGARNNCIMDDGRVFLKESCTVLTGNGMRTGKRSFIDPLIRPRRKI
jgi:hypothetical protein